MRIRVGMKVSSYHADHPGRCAASEGEKKRSESAVRRSGSDAERVAAGLSPALLPAGLPVLRSPAGREGEVEGVLRRARQTLEYLAVTNGLLDIALDHVSLGRAYMAGGELETAGEYLRKAVDGLRAAGQMQYLPLGLLPRASYHRLSQDYAAAQRDLDEVRTLIRRAGLRLYEVDLALEACRLSLARGDKKAAREQLARAQEGIEAMGYNRHKEAAEELAAQIEG